MKIELEVAMDCIYRISFKGVPGAYIGQTGCSIARWGTHISELFIGKHANKKLRGLYNIHGLDSMHFEVLEKDIKVNMDSREKFYICEEGDVFNVKLRNCTFKHVLRDMDTGIESTVSYNDLVSMGLEELFLKLCDKRSNTSKSKKLTCIQGKYRLALKEDTDYLKNVSGLKRKVYKVRRSDKKVLGIYESAREASKVNNYSVGKMSKQVALGFTHDNDDHYFTTDLNGEEVRVLPNSSELKKVRVAAVKDGQKLQFFSLKDCGRHFETDHGNIRYALKTGKQSNHKDIAGWSFEVI